MTDIHEEVRSLLAAYVMDAVPLEEVPAIRAHILTCEDCFAEAEAYAGSLPALVDSVEPSPVPAGFADRVLAAARGDDAPARQPRVDSWGWLRRRFVPVVAALAALALLVVSASLVATLQRTREYERVLAAVVQDRDSLTLAGAGGAEAVIASDANGSILVAVNLGEAPEGREYQLWLMKDGVPTPSNTFDVDRPIVIVKSVRVPARYDGAAITVEPEGGSAQPTTEPILSS